MDVPPDRWQGSFQKLLQRRRQSQQPALPSPTWETTWKNLILCIWSRLWIHHWYWPQHLVPDAVQVGGYELVGVLNCVLEWLSQYTMYIIHISNTYVRVICCFRKYRKTLRAEHMNVSLVTQHGTISGKVSLYLYLLTSWFLSRSVIYLDLWFHWYTNNEDIYAKSFSTKAARW